MKRNPLRYFPIAVTAIAIVLLAGCLPFVSRNDDDGEWEYEEPKPHAYVEPDTVGRHRYLPISPSGYQYNLVPSRIGIGDLSDFAGDSEPAGYLKSLARKSKQAGNPFLPYHYYISPDGMVYDGQDTEYCGYIAEKRIDDAVLVGVLGNFDVPDHFLEENQERALVQLCAWLCAKHAIPPSAIVPINEINPAAAELGANLKSWFGPTQMLHTKIEQTLDLKREELEKKGLQSSFNKRKENRPDIDAAF